MAQDNSHWPEVPPSFESASNNDFYHQTYSSNPPYPPHTSLDLSPGHAPTGVFQHYPSDAPPSGRPGEQELDSSGGALTSPHVGPPLRGVPKNAEPIERMLQERSAPWAAMGNPASEGQGLRFTTPNHPVVRPLPPRHYSGYRNPPHSNAGSSHCPEGHGVGGAAGRPNGSVNRDSGYVTNMAGTSSVHSGMEYVDAQLDDASFTNGFEKFHLQHGATAPVGPPPYPMASQQPPMMPGYEEAHTEHDEVLGGLSCSHTECGDQHFKTQSELRKHKQRHEKLHHCDVRGCARKDGFSTKNDLDRHKKSRHGIRPPNGNDRSYRCAGTHCPKRTKIWPRLDNFKAHCSRIHGSENLDDLLKRSEIEQESPPPADDPPPHNNGPQYTIESPQANRTEFQANRNTLLADLSHPPRNAQFQHDVDHSAYQTADPRRQAEMIVDEGGQLAHDIAQERYAQTPKPTSQQQSRQPPAAAEADSVSMSQSPTTATTDYSVGHDARGDGSVVLAQPPGTKKRKLSTGGALPTSEQVDEASKTIMAEVLKAKTSPESLQSAIAAHMQKFLDTAMQQVAGDGDGFADGDEPMSKQRRLECRICGKTVDRNCDLKKHEKRHSRPWGCTHETCNRTFGSKNDWKRHENSQHYQLETWRCHEPSKASRINECARLFFRRDPFQAHLRRDHDVTDDNYIRDQCRQRRVGRNFQNGFWCGFCRHIVKLHTKGLEAWDERFNHIDDCHFKKGRCIDDWFPMGRDVPKGRIRPDSDRPDSTGGSSTVFDTESASESDFDADDARRQRAARARRNRGAGMAEPLDAVPPPDVAEEQPMANGDGGGPCTGCGQGWLTSRNNICDFCGRQCRARI